MNEDELIVGIDLGTTASAISYINVYGKPEIIPNQEGDRTTPSVIFFEGDGTPIVGKEARNLALVEPTRVVRFIKRELGNPSFRFNVDGRDYFPEDLSAMILRKLKNDAEAYLGQQVNKAVISVPAYFKDAQRECIRQAGEIAGLQVIRIINEPTAAALAYGLERADKDQTILIYDFGGGTFDVTIMRIEGNSFTILATDGDAGLGGKDVDERLVDLLAKEFRDTYGTDLRAHPRSRQDLWDKAEIAKKDLSFRNQLAVVLSSGDRALRVDLDRSLFYEQVEDLIQRTEDCLHRVMESSELSWEQIDMVLLAGGSSRMPIVHEMIERVTGKEAAWHLNPDECVAQGAAVQAMIAAQEIIVADDAREEESEPLESTTQTPIQVTDIAVHSLGVKARSADDPSKYVNSIIIPRFTPLPCEKTRRFVTNKDNQSRVEFEVLQGEETDPLSPEVERIGQAGLSGLPPHRAGELMIEVTLRYNVDGVIEVVTKELMSGRVTRESIMQKSGSLSEEIIEERKSLISNMQL